MWCLDEWLTSELRTAVRSANLYRFDEKVKAEYSLICAVADRVQDADRWLNKHAQLPTNEVDALTWLMLASVIKSSVESLCKKFGVRFNDNDAQSQDNHVHFGEVCEHYHLHNHFGGIVTDDEFFQYFRALTFSHPYGTRKGKSTDERHTNYPFLEQDETLYAPYMVLEKDPYTDCFRGKPVIGVHVYSNKRNDIQSLFVPFESLKSYLLSRHNRLSLISAALRKRVEEGERKFRSERIDRTISSIEQFKTIREVMISRGCEAYSIDEAINYLECGSTCSDNDNAIKEYRQKILELASVLCDEIENLNYEDFTRRLEHVTGCHWDTLPSGISYHTEKVFEYFDGCNNASREWGRQDLLALSADYVGRWVKIDYAMPDVEIRMLVTLAYYMEYGRYRKLELFEEEVSRKRNCLHHKMEMMQDAAGRCVDVRFVEETCGRLDVKPPVAN